MQKEFSYARTPARMNALNATDFRKPLVEKEDEQRQHENGEGKKRRGT